MREMNLRLTLMDSAQAFHWRKIGGVFAAVVDGRVLTSADEDAFARAYFDDARDYSRLMEDCASYPVAARAVQATPGLRVLNQPPWEALLQCILSASNTVARSRALVPAPRARARDAADGRLVLRDLLARVSGAGGAADVRRALRTRAAVAVPCGARGAD